MPRLCSGGKQSLIRKYSNLLPAMPDGSWDSFHVGPPGKTRLERPMVKSSRSIFSKLITAGGLAARSLPPQPGSGFRKAGATLLSCQWWATSRPQCFTKPLVAFKFMKAALRLRASRWPTKAISLTIGRACHQRLTWHHSMNQPWLTTRDCPVSALVGKAAKRRATSAPSSTVVNS